MRSEPPPGPRVYVAGGRLPAWLLLLLAPAVLLLVFFSFALLAAVGLLAAAALPLLWKRRPAAADPSVIELDPSDYRRIETRQPSPKESSR